MTLRDAAAMALGSLRSSAMKTLLTILGLAVGVAAVLTVRALGRAGEAQVEREIARMGVNKVWITRADGGQIPQESVRTASEASGTPACAGAWTAGIAALDAEAVMAQIAGYDAGMQAVHGVSVAEGRPLCAADHDRAQAVCLVDTALAEALGGDVLGRRISIGGRRLLVVGVMTQLPSPAVAVGGGVVVTPLSTFRDSFGTGATEVTLSVPKDMAAGEVASVVRSALGAAYDAGTLENEIGAAREIVRIFVTVLSCVAAVCMVTGAIGVMNVLLISVRERRREIGLIKALGGTAGQAAALFLLEAAGYAVLGGGLGVALGALLTRLFGAFIGVHAAVTVGEAVPVLLSASAMGLLFGVAPAIRAAGMQVVDALRSE